VELTFSAMEYELCWVDLILINRIWKGENGSFTEKKSYRWYFKQVTKLAAFVTSCWYACPAWASIMQAQIERYSTNYWPGCSESVKIIRIGKTESLSVICGDLGGTQHWILNRKRDINISAGEIQINPWCNLFGVIPNKYITIITMYFLINVLWFYQMLEVGESG
jgi:hypothetical protein